MGSALSCETDESTCQTPFGNISIKHCDCFKSAKALAEVAPVQNLFNIALKAESDIAAGGWEAAMAAFQSKNGRLPRVEFIETHQDLTADPPVNFSINLRFS